MLVPSQLSYLRGIESYIFQWNDIKTNEVIEVYPSIQEAERANGNTRHIAEVCKGKRKTCKGYKWKYI